MAKWFIALGAFFTMSGVALGAFGAHGLKGKLAQNLLETYQTGVHYQQIHGLGLILIGLLLLAMPSNLLNWAGWAHVIGILLFSGSLYVLSMTGITKLGMITPFGGVLFIAGWFLVIVAALMR